MACQKGVPLPGQHFFCPGCCSVTIRQQHRGQQAADTLVEARQLQRWKSRGGRCQGKTVASLGGAVKHLKWAGDGDAASATLESGEGQGALAGLACGSAYALFHTLPMTDSCRHNAPITPVVVHSTCRVHGADGSQPLRDKWLPVLVLTHAKSLTCPLHTTRCPLQQLHAGPCSSPDQTSGVAPAACPHPQRNQKPSQPGRQPLQP